MSRATQAILVLATDETELQALAAALRALPGVAQVRPGSVSREQAGTQKVELFTPQPREPNEQRSAIRDQKSEPHPEDICQQCGGPNVVWFTRNELWNTIVPNGGILCPVCFIQRAVAAGYTNDAWLIEPQWWVKSWMRPVDSRGPSSLGGVI